MAKTIDFYALEVKQVINDKDVTTLTSIGCFTHDVSKIETFIKLEITKDAILDDDAFYYIDYESLMAICNEPKDHIFSKEACKEAHEILREVNGDSPGWSADTKFYFKIWS